MQTKDRKKMTTPWAFFFLMTALILLNAAVVHADNRECVSLDSLQGINRKLLASVKESYATNALLFCASTAPSQYMCSCPMFYACDEKPDPWGKNIGSCNCCSWYVILICITLVLLCLGSPIIFLSVLCRKKWYLFGFPPPLPLIVPRRGAITRVLAGSSIPSHLFEEFSRQNFADDEPHRIKREE